uniref:Uncharacterized protein n=1 Tax=Rhizophora mucronata TaxID=61149 RepID=A0A2P2P6U4_RHIMU
MLIEVAKRLCGKVLCVWLISSFLFHIEQSRFLLSLFRMHWIICLQDTSTRHFRIWQGYHLLDL